MTEEPSNLITPTRRLDLIYDDAKHKYTLNGNVVPSVTAILGATIPKDALTWWGFRVGLGAAVELCRLGKLSWPELMGGHDTFERILAGDPSDEFAVHPPVGSKVKKKTLIEHLAVSARMHPNAVRDAAAIRGTGMHDALVTLDLGDVPVVEDLPEHHRPFVQGLVRWWLDHEPQPEAIEHMVAHDELLYAGRPDLFYTDRYGDLVLCDLKTGKDVRPDTWFRQMEAYRQAWEHMGGRAPDRMENVLVRKDGTYTVYPARCNEAAWVSCVQQFHAAREFRALQKTPIAERRDDPEEEGK